MPTIKSTRRCGSKNCESQIRIGAKRQPFGLFPAESPVLFVPSPDQWLIHKASKPTAVAQRANLSELIYFTWIRKHQSLAARLSAWLYNDPNSVMIDEINPSEAMYSFREQAHPTAIAEAIDRPLRTLWVGSLARTSSRMSKATLYNTRRELRDLYPNQNWLDNWLLRGAEPPAGITVVRPDQSARCAMAWDYIEICKLAELRSYKETYSHWLRPPFFGVTDAEILAWLCWLFGARCGKSPPRFVVLPSLQAYRRRGTVQATARAAGVSLPAVQQWRRKRDLRKVLREAIVAARRSKVPDSQEFRILHGKIKRNMVLYAKSTTTGARCKDVGLPTEELHRQLREADHRGAKQDLRDYLNYKGAYKAINLRKKLGLVNGKLFVAPRELLAFRKAATAVWAQHQIGELECLPGFYDWFLVWAVPKKELLPGQTQSKGRGQRPVSTVIVTSDHLKRSVDEELARPSKQAIPIEHLKIKLAGATKTAARKEHKKPAREKHLRWEQLKIAGKSYGEIALMHRHETGDKVTREAVILALKRLRK